MQVSRIEVFGFKSFMERLALPLEGGITGVVGPNGCGKSNIVDAIRWVLGETRAKSLRGGSLEDVIFNGTEAQRPLGLAEVTITLRAQTENFFADLSSPALEADLIFEDQDNAEAENLDSSDAILEVNSAESNSNITEFQQDAQIEQQHEGRPSLRVIEGNLGKESATASNATTTINQPISSSTGLAQHFAWLKGANEVQITRRLYRSGESEFFINRVACRLRDIKEVFRAVGLGPRSYTIVAQGEVSRIISARPEERRTILEEAAGVQGFRDKIAASNRRLEETDINISRLVDIIREVDRQVASLKRQASRAQNRQALKEEIFDLERQLFCSNLKDINNRVEQLNSELVQLHTEENSLENNLQVLRTTEEGKRNELLAIDVQGDTLRAGIDSIKEELNERLRQRSERKARLSELEAFKKARITEIARLEQRKVELITRQNECEKSLELLKAQEADLLEKLKTLDLSAASRLGELAKQRDYLKQAVKEKQLQMREVREALVAKNSSLAAVEQQLVAASPVNQLKETLKNEELGDLINLAGQSRLLIDGISVPEQYAKAVQAILGERAAFLVASNPHSIAKAYVASCKTLDKTGLGLGVLGSSTEKWTNEAVNEFKPLLDLITVDAEFVNVLSQQLKYIYLCETAEQAFDYFARVVDSPITLVTLAGEIITTNSFYSFKHEAGLVQLKQRADFLRAEQSTAQVACEALEQEFNYVQSKLDQAEQDYSATVEVVQAQQSQSNILNNDLGSVRGRLQSEHRMVQQVEQDRDNLTRLFADAQDRINEYEHDLQVIKSEIEAMQPADEDMLHENLRKLQSEYQALDQARTDQRRELSQFAKNVADCRSVLDQQRANISNLSLDLQKYELEKEHIKQRIIDELGNEVLQAWQIEADTTNIMEIDLKEEVRDRLSKLKARIAREGEVDPSSIEALALEETRLVDLQSQKEDLETAARTLRRTIDKLTETSRTRFVQTFNAVQKNFAQLIPRLYGGGKGNIELLDPTNPLESGVDIVVRPPGKKLKSIELLSGGEKALCAIGLVFAMFLVRPSPLCVLDEVDAPLDEANLLRFVNLVKEMSSKTQFIMITHNKGSMSAADRLIGVTMPEPGASKVISVSLQEAYEKVA